MSELSCADLLRLNLTDEWLRIRADLLSRLESGFTQWQFDGQALEGIDKEYLSIVQLSRYLLDQIDEWLQQITTEQQQYAQFQHSYYSSSRADETLSHLLSIAKQLGYSKKARRKMRRGQAKWLDDSAINDHHMQKIALIEQDISVSLQRLADITAFLIGYAEPESISKIWASLALHRRLLPALEYDANSHVRIAAFACLSQSLKALHSLPEAISHRVPPNIVQYIYRTCLDDSVDVWLRCEAIALVFQLTESRFLEVINRILVAEPDSDLFLRGRAVKLLCEYVNSAAVVEETINHVISDPSEYVRQCLAKECDNISPTDALKWLHQIVTNDDSPKVRAQAYLTLCEVMNKPEIAMPSVLMIQLDALKLEQAPFALRTLLHTLPSCAMSLDIGDIAHYNQPLLALLEQMHLGHQQAEVRRWAAQTREHLWFIANRQLLEPSIQTQITELAMQKRLSFAVDKNTDRSVLFRYLAHLGRQRYGFDIVDKGNKIKLTAGFRFGFRFWRFWHEFLNPATDKRQDHNHIKGRLYCGQVQTQSETMAELSVTKVPGEPLFIDAGAGWREYLPLLDQLISSLDQGWPTTAVKIYSVEGITHILPPKNLFKRLYARTMLSLKFAEIAPLRNWQDKDPSAANQYIEQLKKLGFNIWIEGFLDQSDPNARSTKSTVDPSIQRFFNLLPFPLTLPNWADIQNYFYSVYQNTIGQLITFTVIATTGYLGVHMRKLVQLRHHRKRIPLVIGGWGTRGKSGTERLKAALFNAMGLSVVSKTTGCEAMFLYGPANRPMKEMFLFRPYDKASIWEQVFVTGLSAKLGADVFLWECMGLTPRYIDIIQNQWMRDDISTITNCYPDHEDIQGPAGIEIPIVMQRFVPVKSQLITSEESMLPLLEDAARAKQTQLETVTWLEAGLLTDDLMARFPYQEHPNNIALVIRMAATLGIESDFALKAMADNVVADLGVLKLYPPAHVNGRALSFINGMSANERLGAMGNWQRTGLANHSLAQDPNVWLAIVVNNRADRIARSKVFAAMLVNDMQADCYFFIGNNLTGFQSYISEAWQAFIAEFELTATQFKQLAIQFRIPISAEQVLSRLSACLQGVSTSTEDLRSYLPQDITVDNWQLPPLEGVDTQAIATLFHQDSSQCRQYLQHMQQIETGEFDSEKIKDWLFLAFKQKWVVVEDYYSSGNQTINILLQNTPPGLTARVIGVQNIKGTGLDFIYRWQAWNTVSNHCQTLINSQDELALVEATKALCSWEEFGLLDRQAVIQAIAQVKDRPAAQKEQFQAELRLISQKLERQLGEIEQTLTDDQTKSQWLSPVLNAVEAFLDAGDAVKRRKTADRIYQDLLDHLISYDKASVELAKLTKAQKGGWLAQKFASSWFNNQ